MFKKIGLFSISICLFHLAFAGGPADVGYQSKSECDPYLKHHNPRYYCKLDEPATVVHENRKYVEYANGNTYRKRCKKVCYNDDFYGLFCTCQDVVYPYHTWW